ncbi:transposase IS3/IS911 family protein [Rhodomicrobium vannielii ATCC 17100]|uniref:Transposase IS3/IS911 family protein n=2 Tax=Hyphomicrobiaceae TaxID=45401 RepID=E3I0P6_RHOVT|nr:transposase IS3/IS911 family protein [Rhodomicrobium vannielii ATCC 17100]ADP69695.1 transposase IS3/IS911 family protein [Rhodomicrobium vannielii ATCC 17100]ADP70695.1 transposase IS3/IS911 family protein [Rhodomicrobium vannielii ATCC 17100]ADP70735.1 transposase IS3/IS911 family protein [Rhodomicrobium vannielii ATCC 17100]ADP70753.1 transposase IS3/IS911 family protein [Rhodomicrobium vannielii ATCC 17100]
MPMSGDTFARRYSVVADTRRRWSEDEKQAIIAEALQPGVNVSAVARRHGIKPSLLFRWRKLAKNDEKPEPAPAFLPVSLTAPGKSRDTIYDHSASDAPAADNRIEIELLNGRRVRVGPGADMGALKRILDIADGRRP